MPLLVSVKVNGMAVPGCAEVSADLSNRRAAVPLVSSCVAVLPGMSAS